MGRIISLSEKRRAIRRRQKEERARAAESQVLPILSPRWTTMRPHAEQNRLITSPIRFRVVPAGRRSGKTELAKRRLVQAAMAPSRFPDPRYFAAAPTRDQAKRIFWEDLKALTPQWLLLGEPSESMLVIRLLTGAEIWVIGMDKPQRIEGTPWDGGILDEYGNMKAKAWPENVRPSLSDRLGWCWLIGVPEGRNHYFDTYQMALDDDTGEWDAFHWISADILPPGEILAAKRDLDELTYKQEYEGDFILFTGRAYYGFDERGNVAKVRQYYDKKVDLNLMFDFNVAPGVCAIGQEMTRLHEASKLPIVGESMTGIIGEIYIPRDSNTIRICKEIVRKWGGHEGRVFCYGDSSGGAKGTAKIMGSDWELIRQYLGRHFGDRLYFDVPRANPRERDRVNAVNSRCCSFDGDRRLMVDGHHAPYTVKDFLGVQVKEDGTGEIDKAKDKLLTHLTDAIGYYVHREFPVKEWEEELSARVGGT